MLRDLDGLDKDKGKYVEMVDKAWFDEFSEKMRQVENLAPKNLQDEEDLDKRLVSINACLSRAANVPESDLLFVKKMISAIRATVNSCKGSTQKTFNDSLALKKRKYKDGAYEGIGLEEILQIRQNLTYLKNQEQQEIPRIRGNVDDLQRKVDSLLGNLTRERIQNARNKNKALDEQLESIEDCQNTLLQELNNFKRMLQGTQKNEDKCDLDKQ